MQEKKFLDRNAPNLIVRFVVLFVGMSLVAFGIALSRQTLLGSSPISAIPTVTSFLFPQLSMGTHTFIFNIILLCVQIAILRRKFNPVQLFQVPFLFVFSATIDFWVAIVQTWYFENYYLNLAWIILGCIAVALGVYLQTQMRLIMLPGDAVVVVASFVSRVPFSRCKLINDILQMVLAVAISLIGNGYLYGVREGTLIAALAVGPMIRVFSRVFGDFERFIPCAGHPTFLPETKSA